MSLMCEKCTSLEEDKLICSKCCATLSTLEEINAHHNEHGGKALCVLCVGRTDSDSDIVEITDATITKVPDEIRLSLYNIERSLAHIDMALTRITKGLEPSIDGGFRWRFR